MKSTPIINRWRSDDESHLAIGNASDIANVGAHPLSETIRSIRHFFGGASVSGHAFDEQKHDPKNGQFTSGGGAGGKAPSKASGKKKSNSETSNADLVASGNLRAMGGRKGSSEATKKEGPRRGKGGLIHLSEVKGGSFEEKLSNMEPADRKKWERHMAKSEKTAVVAKKKHETVSEIAEKHKAEQATAKRKPKRNEAVELVGGGNLKAMGGRKSSSSAKPTPTQGESGQSDNPDFATLASSLSGKKSIGKKDWSTLVSSYK